MHILSKINLTNDLDLMLAHKRSMQVGEYIGVNLIQQTSFATAVSEVCRLMLDKGTKSCIFLGIQKSPSGKNQVCAKIVDPAITSINPEDANLVYARRLVNQFSVSEDAIVMLCEVSSNARLTREFVLNGQKKFDNLPAVTPYEEAKRLNDQLQEMAVRLGESERKYQILTDTLPMMMFSVDHEGIIGFANKGFKGFSGDGTPVEKRRWADWLTERRANIGSADILAKMRDGKSFSKEILLQLTAESEHVWHLLSMTPIENTVSGLVEWSGFLVNIHAQKLVETTLTDNAELRNIQAMLEKRQRELDTTVENLNRSNQELAKFAYVASHDLQEPARKMIVFSDMVLKKFSRELPAEANEILTRINSASERMVAVIRDLLDYSKVTVEQDIKFEEFLLSEILYQTTDLIDEQIRDSGAQIRLENDLKMIGNKQLVTLLFQNLLGNAIKFVRQGIRPEIVITAGPVSGQPAGTLELDHKKNWISIEIRDNGIGFDEKYVKKIFQMFQRLHTQDYYKGTGIGLAICQRIVEMHEGHLVATSDLNQGSVFSVYLPS